jgi:hypothetical protein
MNSEGCSEKNLDWEFMFRKLVNDLQYHIVSHENALKVAQPYWQDETRWTEGFQAGMRSQCNKLKFILNENAYK